MINLKSLPQGQTLKANLMGRPLKSSLKINPSNLPYKLFLKVPLRLTFEDDP